MKKIKELMSKVLTKEVILYAIFGVLTTLINIGSFYVMTKYLSIDENLANNIAIIIAVLFAYITNRLFVFENKSNTKKGILKEIISFFAFRVLSGILCDVGTFALMVKVFNINDIISKIVTQIMVIIVNYIFSKFIIFKKQEAA